MWATAVEDGRSVPVDWRNWRSSGCIPPKQAETGIAIRRSFLCPSCHLVGLRLQIILTLNKVGVISVQKVKIIGEPEPGSLNIQ